MSGFVKDLFPRSDALRYIHTQMRFPWVFPQDRLKLNRLNGHILGEDITASCDHPLFTRSLRDGYAVNSKDITGASSDAPTYLRLSGEIPMGALPEKDLSSGNALLIYTGGMLPEGADCVVMLEDTALTGSWLEVRRAEQSGANIIMKGEEFSEGDMVMNKGHIIDFRSSGILAHLGITSVNIVKPRIGIISTGDEIVPVTETHLQPGMVRDVNSEVIESWFRSYGFYINRYGIVRDNQTDLEEMVWHAYSENDIVILSGGSSVSIRDFTSEVFEKISSPGMILRGLRIKPGKPTLVAGSLKDKKILFGLPGHPLSCTVVLITFVMPLIFQAMGRKLSYQKKHYFPLADDVYGNTGIEEFIPFRFQQDKVIPVMSKSGYISTLISCDGFIRLDEQKETIRQGDNVEVFIWH